MIARCTRRGGLSVTLSGPEQLECDEAHNFDEASHPMGPTNWEMNPFPVWSQDCSASNRTRVVPEGE